MSSTLNVSLRFSVARSLSCVSVGFTCFALYEFANDAQRCCSWRRGSDVALRLCFGSQKVA